MDAIQIAAKDFLCGSRDAIRGAYLVWVLDNEIAEKERLRNEAYENARRDSRMLKYKTKKSTPVSSRVIQCALLNGGLFWASLLLFYQIVLPSLYWISHIFSDDSFLYYAISFLARFVTLVFSIFWVVPLFCVTRLVNVFWWQDIADAIFKKNLPVGHKPPKMSNFTFSIIIADILFSIFIETVFILQSCLFNVLPFGWLGNLISHMHFALLYSLYAFEYKWFNLGWPLQKRINVVQSNWPYFIGFGVPMAFLTSSSESFIISGCIFATFFPFLIVSANDANIPMVEFPFKFKVFLPVIAFSNAASGLFHRKA